MGRRTVLLIVAVVIAALGAGLVYVYVHGADQRATADQTPVQVLKAVQQIDKGETLAAAQAAGKLQLGEVPLAQRVTGAVDSINGISSEVALTTIYPNEQIITSKFGATVVASGLTIPKGLQAISVSLSDTGRVAGFISPGNKVAIYVNGAGSGPDATRLLLQKIEVIGIGSTTITTTTTTAPSGTQTTEQLPKTLFTLAVTTKQAEQIIFGSTHGTLNLGLLNGTSKVQTGPGITSVNLFG